MAKSDGNSAAFDSDQSYIGTVYAKALLGATEKTKNPADTLAEFDSLVDDVLDKLPTLAATLESPRVPLTEKIGLLDKAFQGRMSEQLLNFLKVVTEHGRFNCVRAIRRAAWRLFNESRGLLEVEVRTAETVDSAAMDSVANSLRQILGSEIDITTRVDPQLIGGIVVRVGDTVYDASVANRLRRVRDAAMQKVASEIRQSIERFSPSS